MDRGRYISDDRVNPPTGDLVNLHCSQNIKHYIWMGGGLVVTMYRERINCYSGAIYQVETVAVTAVECEYGS